MIFGQQVVLRSMELDDQKYVQELNSDPVVRGRVVGWDWPSSLHQQRSWFDTYQPGATHRWIVTNHEGHRIGLSGLWDINWHDRHAMTALKIGGDNPHRGRGAGTDAIKAVMAFAFYDVGLNRLYGAILADNSASIGAYVKKCGWSIEGSSRQHVWRHGKFTDLLHVGVLKKDFDALPDSDTYIDLVVNGPSK